PWNLEHSAGGSSGGAGAALASGLLPIAQGSDGGGSIRIPSSCCGVVGLKTSRGRITNAPQKLEEWAGCAVLGPMARTVRDAALMLDVMAGPTIGEPHWAPNPPAAFRSAAQIPPMKLRIAMIAKSALSSGDRETEAALDAAAKTFESLGHRVEPIDLDPAAMLVGTFMVIVCGATAAEKVPNPQLMDPVVRASREVGLGMTAAQYVEAVHQMHELSRQLLLRLAPYDVLITPTLARPAPRIGSLPSAPERMQQEFGDWAPFAFPWNMTGQPAFSLPNGFNRAGLPIGLQLVGRPADEVTLIQLAAQFEKERPWNFKDQHPQLN
ncbi:MAG TPA: amidase, partial [Candidatus Binataceae bacterium]|nr:amidase [Candidatus Binataceae bacterium]